MVEKVVLTEEKNMYVVLTYNSQSKPKMKTCFSYIEKPREEALKDARDWAKDICRKQGIHLEEKIEISVN